MPGNTIKINKFDKLEWYVGDSKIKELISWLNENGIQLYKNEDKPKKLKFLDALKLIFRGRK